MTSRESAANRVLASIPPREYKRLRSQLEPITVDFGQVLYEPGQAIRHELRFVPIQTSRAVHGTCMLSRRQIDVPDGHVRDCLWCRVSNRYRRHALIQESAYRPFDQCAAIQGFVQRRLGDECVSLAFEPGSALAGQSPARCKTARAGSTGSRARRITRLPLRSAMRSPAPRRMHASVTRRCNTASPKIEASLSHCSTVLGGMRVRKMRPGLFSPRPPFCPVTTIGSPAVAD